MAKQVTEHEDFKKSPDSLNSDAIELSNVSDLIFEQRARWLKIRSLVTAVRERIPAPVDHMGCHVLPENVLKLHSIASQNLQVLLSLLLSSQTKDQNTFAAMQAFRAYFEPDEITPIGILATDESTIDQLIRGVGFHVKKAGYIKKIAGLLFNELKGQIPNSLPELIKLPGIGPKMGILYLQNARPYPGSDQLKNQNDDSFGLAVDTHILRLSQQWRLVTLPSHSSVATMTPELARAQLEQIVPREQWKEANPLLVGFGQTVCGARSKRCSDCDVSGTGLCSADQLNTTSAKRKIKQESLKIKDIEDLHVVKKEINHADQIVVHGRSLRPRKKKK
ncbi:DNA glycosylase [Lipomyces japonicus]|uniref:DNA glycosylase n=1 Tax=Lipomyces japonicus TaxID=56871 RepID=UPI0034CE793A